jgi:hypothetical protein
VEYLGSFWRGPKGRAGTGKLTEVWHQEDTTGMLHQLGLELPPAIMRFAARRSARRYRREHAATG